MHPDIIHRVEEEVGKWGIDILRRELSLITKFKFGSITLTVTAFSVQVMRVSKCAPLRRQSSLQSYNPRFDRGDVAFIIVAGAMVSFMIPGLAFLYSGMCACHPCLPTLL